MSSGVGVVGAALVPGMPHLLAEQPAESWSRLRDATRRVGELVRRAEPDVVLLLSTQWFTVLGHQFQLDPNPQGRHTDENWYAFDYGHLDYNLKIDVAATEQWATEVTRRGQQARRTQYDGFPIDTGTIVASNLLDPDGTLSWAQVSCNLYAGAETIALVGAAGAQAITDAGLRAVVVAVTGLSSGLIQRWIQPSDDRISHPEHERWNRAVLAMLEAGEVDRALGVREAFAAEAGADSQFRALAFLAGTGAIASPAAVAAYGPVWGTGAATVTWNLD